MLQTHLDSVNISVQVQFGYNPSIYSQNTEQKHYYICLFDLILYADGSSWVEPVLSKGKCVLLKDTLQ